MIFESFRTFETTKLWAKLLNQCWLSIMLTEHCSYNFKQQNKENAISSWYQYITLFHRRALRWVKRLKWLHYPMNPNKISMTKPNFNEDPTQCQTMWDGGHLTHEIDCGICACVFCVCHAMRLPFSIIAIIDISKWTTSIMKWIKIGKKSIS